MELNNVFYMNGTDVSSNLVDNHLDWLVNSPDIISSELSLTRWQTHPSFIDNFQTPAFDAANYNSKSFFDQLDKDLGKLKINSYGVGITTLEEVFLRIGHGEN